MSDRTVRRFVEGLLRGQSTERARPDDVEAEQMKTAIELRAARLGSDSPSEDFVTDLHRRLAAEMSDDSTPVDHPRWAPRRRQVVIGGSVAAASAAAGLVVGRNLLAPNVSAAGIAVRPGGARTQRGNMASHRRECRPT